MAAVDILSLAGSVKGQVELPDALFAREGRAGLVWESVRCYLANQRQGTASVKTRTTVSGTGKKPYRQKHTGRARHGSLVSPIHVGGGIAWGPHPRDYSYELPKKVRRQALAIALTARRAEGAVRVIEDFDVPAPKTKELAKLLGGLSLQGSVLLLTGTTSENLKRASRNIPWLTLIQAREVNPYHVLNHDNVVITEGGVSSLAELTGAAS